MKLHMLMLFEAMTFLFGIGKLHNTVCSAILCIYTRDFILPKLHVYLREQGKEQNRRPDTCFVVGVVEKEKKKRFI